MPKTPPLGTDPEPSQTSPDDTLESGFFELTPEGSRKEGGASSRSTDETLVEPTGPAHVPDMERPLDEIGHGEPYPSKPRNTRVLKIAAIVVAVLLVLGGVLLVRQQRQQRALREGLAKAADLMRPDTYAGYVTAAEVLKSLVPLDPLEAGSARAFALGMLVSDYREESYAKEAETLLVEPERASVVPTSANLAEAALLLTREAGTAMTFAARAPGNPWSGTLQARVAMWAGNLSAANELLSTALALDAGFPAALALKGDLLRRRKDFGEARVAYATALQTSPTHPRAAFGMAKLALAERIPRDLATRPLEQMLADPATHANERARAALHLATLRARGGDRAGATAAIEAARVPPSARLWMEQVVSEEASRTGYHVAANPPSVLQSPHDDDPYEPAPPPPPPPATGPPRELKAVPRAEPSRPSSSHVKAAKKSKPTKAVKASKTKKATAPAKKSAKKPAKKKSSTRY